MKRKRVSALLVAVGLSAVVTAASCVATAWVPLGPPGAQVEVQTMAPGPGFIWINGWWEWHGDWAWHRGYWARPPRPRATWEPPRWEHGERGWRWHPGQWRD